MKYYKYTMWKTHIYASKIWLLEDWSSVHEPFWRYELNVYEYWILVGFKLKFCNFIAIDQHLTFHLPWVIIFLVTCCVCFLIDQWDTFLTDYWVMLVHYFFVDYYLLVMVRCSSFLIYVAFGLVGFSRTGWEVFRSFR